MAESSDRQAAGETAPAATPTSSPSTAAVPRRNLLAAISAAILGGLLSIFPFAAGAFVFLDPLLKKKDDDTDGGETPGKWLRVATLDSIPDTGSPVQFPVIDDLVDAWNRQPNQPVGAVYLRRVAAADAAVTVEAFNALCPHAGCFVAFSPLSDDYKCPCHNSSFALDGSKIETPGAINPSPRPLDKLEIDQDRLAADGEVWVKFVNYYTGKHEQVAK